MSAFENDDLTSALRKLSLGKFKKENLPKNPLDPLWTMLLSTPFNMDLNEVYALKNSVMNPTPTPAVTPLSSPITERYIDLEFSTAPCADLQHCLDRVPDVSLRKALLGPGPCLFRALPLAIVLSNDDVVNPTRAMVEDVLTQLATFVSNMNPVSKPNISDEYLMAIRLYTMEDPIPFFRFVNEPLNDTDRLSKIANIAPYMRLLIKALEAFGEAGYSMEAPAYRGLRVRQNPALLQKYQSHQTAFPVSGLMTFAGFTSVSLDGNAPTQFGDALLLTMRSVRGVDVSSLSKFPNERELLLIPPVVFRIDTVSKFHGLLTIGLTQVQQRDACYLSPPPGVSAGVSSARVNSVLHAEFEAVFVRLVCNNRTEWDRMHTLAIDNRDPLAQAVLAIGYSLGFFSKDVEMSHSFGSQCLEWLRSQTDEYSFLCLGMFSYHGIAVPADKIEAKRYLKLPAEAGNLLAQSELGACFYCEKNFVEAVKWYRLAADAGYCVAQSNLAASYYDGEGVTRDFEQAANWYRMAALQGYPRAQYRLGLGYLYGEGVEKDFAKSVRWLQLAADQGYAHGQCELGIRYYRGEGVEKNYGEAVRWFRLAVDKGDSNAQTWLGWCYEHGYGVAANKAEMIRWYRLAVAQDEKGAQYGLGRCYETGNGVNKDINEAIRLYTLASEQGNQLAIKRLNVLRPSKK